MNACTCDLKMHAVIIFMVKFKETQMFIETKSEKNMGKAEVSHL